jgi:hypothetical protein
VVFGAVASAWLADRAPLALVAVYALVAVGVAQYHVRRAWRWWRRRTLDQRVVRPLYLALRQMLGEAAFPADAPMSSRLSVPLGYEDDRDARIVVTLPPGFSGDGKVMTAISRLVGQKLGIEVDGHWQMVGKPYVEYTHRPTPPSSVVAADIMERIAEARHGEVIIGLGTRSESISIDLDAETPHVGMNIGTGGGKSSTLRGAIAQLYAQGSEIVILDPAGASLPEFEDVPGITIVTEIPDIWTTIERVCDEMERRYAEWMKDRSKRFRRLVLVLEEANDFYLQSAQYWESIRSKQDSKVPPPYPRLARIMIKGRKAWVNLLGVYQQMDAPSVGGGGPNIGSLARAQYGMKILARFSPQAWAFLVGTSPRPKSSRHPGRAFVLVGDDMRVCQMAFWTPEEAREFALSNRPEVSVTPTVVIPRQRQESDSVTALSGRPSLRVLPGGADDDDSEPMQDEYENDGTETVEGHSIEFPARRYTLAEAARERVIPISYGALREAKSRAGRTGGYFPVGRTVDGKTTYTAEELQAWYESRQRVSGE